MDQDPLQTPLRGGPLDGATVHISKIHDGRYIERRIAWLPEMGFDPHHDPTGPIEETPMPRETVVYELRVRQGDRWLEYVGKEA